MVRWCSDAHAHLCTKRDLELILFGPTSINYSHGSLALLPDGSVIVTDSGHILRMLSADLQQVSTLQVFLRRADAPVKFFSEFAHCMAVSPEGSLLVASKNGERTEIFSLGGWFDDSVAMCQRRQARVREGKG